MSNRYKKYARNTANYYQTSNYLYNDPHYRYA